jgi:hypothetical protein
VKRKAKVKRQKSKGKSQKAKVALVIAMGFGLRVVSELLWYFVGLDLGQSRNHSALAVVERAEIFLDEMDWVTYERRRERRFRVPFLERVRLGTPYPGVVDRVREVVRAPELAGRCTLVMDATGVGAPVLDLLRQAGLGCGIEAVILTGGERESHAGGVWHVPKRDLVSGLQTMLERRELELPLRFGPAELLGRELASMGARMNERGRVRLGAMPGEHDDLVIACALACWRARWKSREMCRRENLGLG